MTPNVNPVIRSETRVLCGKRGCGAIFEPKRPNQRYCKKEHRPPNYTLRLTAAQAELIVELASRLTADPSVTSD